MDKLKNAANNDIKVIYEKLGVGDVYAITMTTGTKMLIILQKLLKF
jgi:hypothetical protein